MQRFNVCFFTAFLTVFFMASACSKSDGGEAKKRVMEKKDLTEEVKTRKVRIQEIDLSGIPADIDEFEKVLLMTQEEIAAKLKTYTFKSSLSYETSRKGKSVTLSEQQEFEQTAEGDYHLKVMNDKTSAFELYWVGEQIYERMGSSPFRKNTSTGKHLFWREKAYDGLDRFYKYFRGHLLFSDAEPTSYQGRPALKVEFSLNPDGKTPEEDLPVVYNFPNQYALSVIASEKLVNKNRKLISRFDEAEGIIIIDKKEACVLSYRFTGKYVIPVNKKRLAEAEKKGIDLGKEVSFRMVGGYDMKNIGKPVRIVRPKAQKPVKRDRPPENLKPLLPKGSKLNPELEEKAKESPEKTEEAKPTKP